MKYFNGETTEENEKIYRDCMILNLSNLKLEDGPDDLIISEDNIAEDAIIVDTGIAEIVRDLNKKGYKTLFSCQGHLDKDIFKDKKGELHSGITSTYIMFEAGEFLNKYITHIFQLPIQFEVEIDDNICDTAAAILNKTYYWNYRNTINSSKKRITIQSKMSFIFTDEEDGLSFDVDKLSVEKFNRYNTMDLRALAEWVNNLPDLTKESVEFSHALYDERVIDHDTAKQCGFDFESVQEYVDDIKESYNIAADSIKEINEQMTIISDMITHIGKRLAAMKVVDDVRDIDDTSMYESCIIEESFPTKDDYKDLVKYLKDLRHHPLDRNKSKYTPPISPEEIENLWKRFGGDTAINNKDLVNKAYEEYNERHKDFVDNTYGFMNNKTK